MDSNVSAWNFGASIWTFAPLYLLFAAVAITLWMLYIKPVITPGHRANARTRAMADTFKPGQASTTPQDKTGE
jgi:hypothetical protein